MDIARWKQDAAEAAAKLVKNGEILGLGSGTTVVEVVRCLAKRGSRATIVPGSIATERLASELGLKLGSLDQNPRLDLMIDGADEVDADFNLIKGGGGAHTREKIVASAAKRVVIVVDSTKLVRRLGERMPVPVEVLPFAHEFTARKLAELGGKPRLRLTEKGRPFETDNGNYIIDVKFARIGIPAELERAINDVPGVLENGIFVGATDLVFVGYWGGCKILRSEGDFLALVRKLRGNV